jgi:hypothetical protein
MSSRSLSVRARAAALALATSFGFAAAAVAAPVWGTLAVASLGDMRSTGGQNNFTIVGSTDPADGEGVASSSASIDDSTMLDFRGTGPWNRAFVDASATISGGATATPATLRARAVLTGNISNQSGVVDAAATAMAFASEEFQYIGAAPGSLSITFTLTGSLDNSPVDPFLQTGVFASAVIFPSANYEFTTDHDHLVFNLGITPKAEDFVSTLVVTSGSGGAFTRSVTLTFSVTPGETFHVWQRLDTWAAGDDRFADAFSTLTSSFDQPHLVRSLSVPEPGIALLLGAAGLVAWRARRVRSASRV